MKSKKYSQILNRINLILYYSTAAAGSLIQCDKRTQQSIKQKKHSRKNTQNDI